MIIYVRIMTLPASNRGIISEFNKVSFRVFLIGLDLQGFFLYINLVLYRHTLFMPTRIPTTDQHLFYWVHSHAVVVIIWCRKGCCRRRWWVPVIWRMNWWNIMFSVRILSRVRCRRGKYVSVILDLRRRRCNVVLIVYLLAPTTAVPQPAL